MGEVIQIRDHQSRRQREQAQAALEAQDIELANICFPSIVCTGNDTAPSEMNPFHGDILGACGPCENATLRISDLPPYVAPDKDSA